MRLKYEGDKGVRSVLVATKEAVQSNFSSLVKAIGLFFILSLALEFTYYYIFYTAVDDAQFSFSFEIMSSIISALLWLCIAVRTHRVLINQNFNSNEFAPSIKNAESYIRFALRIIWLLILLSLCYIPYAFLMFLSSGDFSLAVFFIVCTALTVVLTWYVCRFFLVLPSIAIGIPMTFSESFSYTERHQFLLFFTVMLMPIFLAYIPYLLFVYFFESSIILNMLSTILSNSFLVFEVALLSMTYIYIVKRHNNLNEMKI